MKHDYFIEDLGQPAGWFKAHRYRYLCMRCGWVFIVENRAGEVSAMGEGDEGLPEPQNSQRIKTFVDGPCTPLPAGTAARRAHHIVQPWIRKPRPAVRRRADGIAQIMACK
jgi:hypothetical protein